MLQHLIIHFSLHYLSIGRLLEVKNKGKFQTFDSKSGRCLLREVVDRLQEIPNIVIRETFGMHVGKLVAEERRSLTRGGRNRRFDCNHIIQLETSQKLPSEPIK